MTEKTVVYNFKTQLEIGYHGEAFLDDYFRGRGVQVEVVDDLDTQRRGIDRYFRMDGWDYSVEYKTDLTAGRTGNAFLEMVVDKKAGWVMRTQADFVAYFVPGDRIIYLFRPNVLREQLPGYINVLEWKTIRNDRFVAFGMVLPLECVHNNVYCLRGISAKVYDLRY